MRIARIAGIDVFVHPSWLFVFALVTWSLSSDIGPLRHLELAQHQRFVLGTLGAAVLFLSVLAHELAYAFAARRSDLRVRAITLFLFGGVSRFEDEPAKAPAAAWIALVGPLVNVVLAGIFAALAAVDVLSTPLGALFRLLAGANLMLGALNLLPAYPLDGGRILHTFIWRRTGDRMRASIISSRVGRLFALGFVGYGIYVTFASGSATGLWITFMGWFLLQAGSVEEAHALVARSLSGHSALELASVPDETLPADATAHEALAVILRSKNGAVPVNLGDRCIGILTGEDFHKLKGRLARSVYVTSLMTRIDDLERVAPSTPATDALRLLKRSGRCALAVMDAEGNLLGFFNHDATMRWVAADLQPTAPVFANVRRYGRR